MAGSNFKHKHVSLSRLQFDFNLIAFSYRINSNALVCRFTYEISPVFSLMEKEITRKMIELIGWPNKEAIFAPGKYFLQCDLSSKLSQNIRLNRKWIRKYKCYYSLSYILVLGGAISNLYAMNAARYGKNVCSMEHGVDCFRIDKNARKKSVIFTDFFANRWMRSKKTTGSWKEPGRIPDLA